MPPLSPRLVREHRTLSAMIDIYCRGCHPSAHGSCPECAELREYAERRLDKCPFHEEKPPCDKCPIHCYEAQRRAQMKAVMRYAGPRMLLRHPIFALRHWIDAFRPVPELRRGGRRQAPR